MDTATNQASVTVPSLDQIVAPNGAATYYVSASFVAGASSSYSTITPANTNVVLGKEGQGAGGSANGSSRVDFTGTQFVSVGTAPRLTATLFQSLAPEAADVVFVDFSKVIVNARIPCTRPAVPPPPRPTAATWTSAAPSGSAPPGTVSVNAPKTLAEGAYLVVVTVTDNAFVLPLVGTSTLTVGATTGNYMNGGGTVNPDSTSNAQNPAGSFGFNVRSGNSGPDREPRLRLPDADRHRAHGHDRPRARTWARTCRDVDVIIRSAPIGNFVPGQSTTYPRRPSSRDGRSRSTSMRPIGSTPYAGYGFTGGNFRLDATDFATNGANDTSASPCMARWNDRRSTRPSSRRRTPITQTGITAATNQVVLSPAAT